MLLHEHVTERLKFRCLTPDDETELFTFFNHPASNQFLSVSKDLKGYTSEWLNRQMRRYEMGGGLHAVELKETGEFIGQCGLVWQFVDGIPKWEVGYHLLNEYWDNGYATEAAKACRDFCFENEMAETLIAIVHPENIRSIKVAERIGMTHWKDTNFKGNDVKVMRIRREDWERMNDC